MGNKDTDTDTDKCSMFMGMSMKYFLPICFPYERSRPIVEYTAKFLLFQIFIIEIRSIDKYKQKLERTKQLKIRIKY